MKNKQPAATRAEGQTGRPNQAKRTTSFIGGGTYEIKVQGQLDTHWSEWLGGLVIEYDDEGNTLLTGIILDQAGLHGILAQIRDLGVPLLALKRIES